MSGHAAPGATPDDEDDRWLIAIEVAALIGRSERTARTWVAERHIPARAGRPERWSERAIRAHLPGLPRGNPGATPETAPGQPGRVDESFEAVYRVTPAEIEQAVSRTSAQYMGDLRTMLVEVGKVYEGQLAAKDAALAAKDQALAMQTAALASKEETIAELRRRAEQAEAERDRLAAVQVAQDGPGTSETPTVAQHAAPGLWARLRRRWRADGGPRAR